MMISGFLTQEIRKEDKGGREEGGRQQETVMERGIGTHALHVGMVWGQSKDNLERANNSHGHAHLPSFFFYLF